MDLFHCISPGKLEERAKARSEDREPVAPPRGLRRPSLPAQQQPPSQRKVSAGSGWSAHYESKKSSESLERLTSRTLSPPPETLPRKFSRASCESPREPARLPRHPHLPPLNVEDEAGPRLADYLEKPRLVRIGGRRPSQVEPVEQLVPGLAQLSTYYNQTFLSSCDTCDSMSHTNPAAVIKNNRCM